MATNLFFKSVVLSIFVAILPFSIQKPLMTSTTKPTTFSIGVCQMPLRAGYCMGYFPRWFYNHKTKKCQQFVYGGCDGNNNNFLSKTACELTCHAGKQGLMVAPVLPTFKSTTVSKESRKKIDIKPKNSKPPPPPPPPQNQTVKSTKPCEIEKKKAMDFNQLNLNQSQIFVPKCDSQGNYETMQCQINGPGLGTSCWCLDKNGRKIGEATKTLQGKHTCDKTSLLRG